MGERAKGKGREERAQSLRVATSLKGATKLRSALVTVRRSKVWMWWAKEVSGWDRMGAFAEAERTAILQGLVTTALRSTVSTSGSLSAISLMHE